MLPQRLLQWLPLEFLLYIAHTATVAHVVTLVRWPLGF